MSVFNYTNISRYTVENYANRTSYQTRLRKWLEEAEGQRARGNWTQEEEKKPWELTHEIKRKIIKYTIVQCLYNGIFNNNLFQSAQMLLHTTKRHGLWIVYMFSGCVYSVTGFRNKRLNVFFIIFLLKLIFLFDLQVWILLGESVGYTPFAETAKSNSGSNWNYEASDNTVECRHKKWRFLFMRWV